MTDKIENILEQEVRPALLAHEGNTQIVSYEEDTGILKIRLTGHCSGCPSARLTTEELIEQAIRKKIPEVKKVVLVNEVSAELMEMAKKILRHEVVL